MHLTEWCRSPTSGAFGVEPFEPDEMSLLVASHVDIGVSGRSGGCASRWLDDALGDVEEFAYCGGADAAVAPDGGQCGFIGTSHTLSADDRTTAHLVMRGFSERAE